jgi:hypothetical protein
MAPVANADRVDARTVLLADDDVRAQGRAPSQSP